MPDPARSGHDAPVSRTRTAPEAPSTALPAATRARPPGWRDPRLWIGIAIVAASVVIGARVVGSADDTVTVWSVATDLAPGHQVTEADLVVARVRFEEESTTSLYLATDEELPADLHLVRGLTAGELLPRAALGSATDAGTVQVSVAVAPQQVPPGVGAGDRVNVWVVDEARGDSRPGASRVLEDVVVVAAPAAAESFGSVADGRQLVLGVPRDESEAVASILAASGDDRVRIVGRS